MKKLCIFVLVLLFSFGVAASVMAAGNGNGLSRLIDDANLLSGGEYSSVLQLLDQVSEDWDIDVVIATTHTTNGATVESYSDTFYSNGGYDEDGILLLISMEERDVIVTPYGSAIDSFTNAGCEYMLEQLLDNMSDGDYQEAFEKYAGLCDDFMKQAKSGEPYGRGNLPKGSFRWGKSLLISAIVGLVIALIVTGIMRGQLKSVRFQAAADNYVKPGSLNITQKQDLFLYRNVVRTPRPKSNSGGSGRVSSGGGRPGAKGKF